MCSTILLISVAKITGKYRSLFHDKQLTFSKRKYEYYFHMLFPDPNYDGAWIGLNDIHTEGTFHWLNGTHVAYTKWALKQPNNNDNHDCVWIKVGEGTWYDISCARQLPFVCEKKTQTARQG